MPLPQYNITTPVPMIWQALITPKPGNPKIQSKPRYETTLLFTREHPDWAPIEKLMIEVCVGKFGRIDGRKFPVRDGNKVAEEAKNRVKDGKPAPLDREFLRGKIMFQPHGLITTATGNPVLPPRLLAIVDSGQVKRFDNQERALAALYLYSGVMVVGQLAFNAYEGMGGGVSAYVNEIVSLNYGDRIATGGDDESRLASNYGDLRKHIAHVGQATNYNPTIGAASIV